MRAAAGCGDDDDDSDDAATDTPGAAENGGDTGVELTMWTRSARHPHHIDGWLPAAQLHLDPTDLTHITTATPAPH